MLLSGYTVPVWCCLLFGVGDLKRRERKFLDASFYVDWAFRNSLGRLPHYHKYSPGIRNIGNSNVLVQSVIADFIKNRDQGEGTPTFLDFGARDAAKRNFAQGCVYTGADISPGWPGIIAADMCLCPQIADESYDIVFSFDVLEHVQRPWDAARECLRITRKGGLVICRTLFSYRYHPEPKDFWRFTSQGLEFLFINEGHAETLVSGYDIRERRRNRKGVFLEHRPPIDWLGGWRENWQVLWIGRKL